MVTTLVIKCYETQRCSNNYKILAEYLYNEMIEYG